VSTTSDGPLLILIFKKRPLLDGHVQTQKPPTRQHFDIDKPILIECLLSLLTGQQNTPTRLAYE
jgi:hypothetical protein